MLKVQIFELSLSKGISQNPADISNLWKNLAPAICDNSSLFVEVFSSVFLFNSFRPIHRCSLLPFFCTITSEWTQSVGSSLLPMTPFTVMFCSSSFLFFLRHVGLLVWHVLLALHLLSMVCYTILGGTHSLQKHLHMMLLVFNLYGIQPLIKIKCFTCVQARNSLLCSVNHHKFFFYYFTFVSQCMSSHS